MFTLKITKRFFIALSILVCTACTAEAVAPISESNEDATKNELAIKLIKQMQSGKFSEAVLPFDKKMKSGLSADKLEQVWQQINQQAGPYQKVLNTSQKSENGFVTVFVATQFEYAILDTKVAFNSENQIVGLFFSPSKYKPDTKPSPTDNSVQTQAIEFGGKDWSLSGEITFPKNNNSAPLLILVHGSGPQDMDSTIGPNKPFRDIAFDLAHQGIATLRYNKRTFEHATQYVENPALVAKLTFNEETVDDAVFAFNFAKTIENINTNRIFIAGISQGGMLMPRIAQQTPTAAGYIMLAAPARGLEVLVQEQYDYIFGLDNEISTEEQQAVDTLQAQVKNLVTLTESSEFKPNDLPLNLSQHYWLALKNYDLVKEAKDIDKPLLIVQGGRDYQVLASKDFKIWKDSFYQAENATLKLFPKLNHLMFAGDKPSVPAEYYEPSQVDKGFLKTLGQWINNH